jgi:hypothetical protein
MTDDYIYGAVGCGNMPYKKVKKYLARGAIIYRHPDHEDSKWQVYNYRLREWVDIPKSQSVDELFRNAGVD